MKNWGVILCFLFGLLWGEAQEQNELPEGRSFDFLSECHESLVPIHSPKREFPSWFRRVISSDPQLSESEKWIQIQEWLFHLYGHPDPRAQTLADQWQLILNRAQHEGSWLDRWKLLRVSYETFEHFLEWKKQALLWEKSNASRRQYKFRFLKLDKSLALAHMKEYPRVGDEVFFSIGRSRLEFYIVGMSDQNNILILQDFRKRLWCISRENYRRYSKPKLTRVRLMDFLKNIELGQLNSLERALSSERWTESQIRILVSTLYRHGILTTSLEGQRRRRVSYTGPWKDISLRNKIQPSLQDLEILRNMISQLRTSSL